MVAFGKARTFKQCCKYKKIHIIMKSLSEWRKAIMFSKNCIDISELNIAFLWKRSLRFAIIFCVLSSLFYKCKSRVTNRRNAKRLERCHAWQMTVIYSNNVSLRTYSLWYLCFAYLGVRSGLWTIGCLSSYYTANGLKTSAQAGTEI